MRFPSKDSRSQRYPPYVAPSMMSMTLQAGVLHLRLFDRCDGGIATEVDWSALALSVTDSGSQMYRLHWCTSCRVANGCSLEGGRGIHIHVEPTSTTWLTDLVIRNVGKSHSKRSKARSHHLLQAVVVRCAAASICLNMFRPRRAPSVECECQLLTAGGAVRGVIQPVGVP